MGHQFLTNLAKGVIALGGILSVIRWALIEGAEFWRWLNDWWASVI
jgi:hypothetical protein